MRRQHTQQSCRPEALFFPIVVYSFVSSFLFIVCFFLLFLLLIIICAGGKLKPNQRYNFVRLILVVYRFLVPDASRATEGFHSLGPVTKHSPHTPKGPMLA